MKSARRVSGAQRRRILRSLEETDQALLGATAAFNAVGDPQLTQAWVFEIGALRARHSYLLRQLKAL